MIGKRVSAGVLGLGLSVAACSSHGEQPSAPEFATTTTAYVAPDKSIEENEAERSLYLYVSGPDAESAGSDFTALADRVGTYDLAARQKITRVVLSFAGLSTNADGSSTPNIDDTYINKQSVEKTRALFPNAEIGMAIGGWNEALADPWQAALEQPAVFAAELAFTANELDIDTVALDFEFPSEAQKEAYTALVDTTVKQLTAVGVDDVTVAIPAMAEARRGFDLPALTNSGARLEAMLYDMHGSWEPVIAHDSSNQDAARSVDAIIAEGILPKDILMGYGMYGRRYQDVPDPQNPLGQPISEADKNTDNAVLNTTIETQTATGEWLEVDLGEAGRFLANPATNELYTVFAAPDIQQRNQLAAERRIGRFAWGLQTMTESDLIAFVS